MKTFADMTHADVFWAGSGLSKSQLSLRGQKGGILSALRRGWDQVPWENHGKTIGKWWFFRGFDGIYPTWLCNIAMENDYRNDVFFQ